MAAERAPHLLIVKMSSLGDIIHALPAACSLRATWPGARIGWVVERRWLPLIQRHPDVDDVFTLDSFLLRRSWRTLPAFRSDLDRLRAFRPDWAIDLQGTMKSAAVTWLSGATHRAGFAAPAVRERLAPLFYTHTVAPRSPHIVDQLLDVLELSGPLRRDLRFPFPIPADAAAEVDTWLRDQRIGDFVFLSPGGGWGSKRWPLERYGQLAALLQQRFGIVAVLNHGPGESALQKAFLHAHARPCLFSGDITRLAAILRRARLVIGGDTGPLHLAAVLGTPVVALFGPTDPARNGPHTTNAIVLRRETGVTYQRSHQTSSGLLAISVEEVLEASTRLLHPAPEI